MACMVQYRGRIFALQDLASFEERVLRVTLSLGCFARLWHRKVDGDLAASISGLQLILAQGQEPCNLLISPDGKIIRPRDTETVSRCGLPDPPWCGVDTQLSGPFGHCLLIELLLFIKGFWFPQLEILDPTGYVNHQSPEQLCRHWEQLQQQRFSDCEEVYFESVKERTCEQIDAIRASMSERAFSSGFTIGDTDPETPLLASPFQKLVRSAQRSIRKQEFEAELTHRCQSPVDLNRRNEREQSWNSPTQSWTDDDRHAITTADHPIADEITNLLEPEPEPEPEDSRLTAVRECAYQLWRCAQVETLQSDTEEGHAAAYDLLLMRAAMYAFSGARMYRTPWTRRWLSRATALLDRSRHASRWCRRSAFALRLNSTLCAEASGRIVEHLTTLDERICDVLEEYVRIGDSLDGTENQT